MEHREAAIYHDFEWYIAAFYMVMSNVIIVLKVINGPSGTNDFVVIRLNTIRKTDVTEKVTTARKMILRREVQPTRILMANRSLRSPIPTSLSNWGRTKERMISPIGMKGPKRISSARGASRSRPAPDSAKTPKTKGFGMICVLASM